ncbi:caspase recruitment domain-containing protein 8-like [Coregonus clupeaformis]|uniref:caspase recruitment domain-containing protein 8-like n=1 Tax=Coregonus clupeaformis TaxID=59861 RepID=UPI001BDFB50E|nr:caspase recruitment domain-containing protein 8-like [Coregonus clupeaformis]
MPTFLLRLKTVVEEVNLLLEEHDGPENERVWNRLVSLQASPTEVKSTAPLPAATPARPPTFSGWDFITKHKSALETRLGLLPRILSLLEDHKVLNAEEREEVVSKSTDILKNQALLNMVVKKGARAQKQFYQVLKEVNPYLVEDLEEQTV